MNRQQHVKILLSYITGENSLSQYCNLTHLVYIFAVPGGRRWCVFWSLTLRGQMRVFPDPRCPARGPLWQSTPCASRTPPPPYSEEKSSSSGRMALLLRCTKPEACTVYSHKGEGVFAKRRTVSCGWLCNVLSLSVKREIKQKGGFTMLPFKRYWWCPLHYVIK